MERPGITRFDEGTVFRSLFAAYPDALLLVDMDGTIVLANPAAESLLGYAAVEFIGLSVDMLVPDAIRPRHAAYRHAYAEHPRTRPMGTQMDLVAKRRDGSEVMVEIALSPLRDHGVPLVVAAIRDVGAYPRVKQALQRARYSESLAQVGRFAVDARDLRQLLAQVTAVMADALQVETAQVLLLEPSGVEFRIASAVGLPDDDLVDTRVAVDFGSVHGRVVAQGKAITAGDPLPRPPAGPSAAGPPSELAVPLLDRGRTIGVLAARSRLPNRFGDDETRFLSSLASLLATVLQREKSEEALNHSQRLESVGQLTGGIAHDFNNLLTVIAGNLQVLEDAPTCVDDPAARQLIDAAMRATRRSAELTNKLLAFSRRQVLQPVVVNTRTLLRSLTDMLRRTLDQRIRISLEAKDLLCMADPGQLESALLNIAINARDAMPDGGTLAFSCRMEPSLPPDLGAEADGAAEDGYVAIAIADNGSGMPEAVRERAFEPFFTTKEAGRGTGLGLSTVYGFAKQSRGAVRLESSPGAGTKVELYLPRVREPALDPEAPESASRNGVPAGLHVLLVEDEAEVRAVVRAFLTSMGCQVTACAEAGEALRLLASGDAFGLLLTDVALGAGMRGTELAHEARARRPALPVLLMSGFSAELLGSPPGWELLRKPCTRTQLKAAIARALSSVTA